MPWDCFCPKCSCCCVGGMTDDPDEMDKEIEEYKGENIECLSCGCVFDFDTGNVIEEKLAEYAHNAWSGWMIYLFEKSKLNDDGTVTIPKWAVDRWTRQMNTEYIDLPEEEMKSDRQEAKKIISIWG